MANKKVDGGSSSNFFIDMLKGLVSLAKNITIRDIINIFVLVLITWLLILGFTFYKHPDVFFERYDKYVEQKHNQSFARRMEVSPLVQANLDKLIAETGAYRAFIVEMHNGRYNSAGLSFNYGALTYESLRSDAQSIREDYVDFSLERYPITLKIYRDGYWFGSIEDMQTIDERLSLRLKSNGVHYALITNVYCAGEAVGFLGLTYREEDKFDEHFVKSDLLKTSAKVGGLLNGTPQQDADNS